MLAAQLVDLLALLRIVVHELADRMRTFPLVYPCFHSHLVCHSRRLLVGPVDLIESLLSSTFGNLLGLRQLLVNRLLELSSLLLVDLVHHDDGARPRRLH